MRAVALVNGNARAVTARVVRELAAALPGRVFATRSLDEARAVLRAEVRRGLDLVVFGGGDGTVVMGLALLAEACRGAGKPEPAIGVAALGSGNALARALGADLAAPVSDILRLARGEGRWRAQPMLDVLGLRAPFAGIGIDAQLLEDQQAVDRAVDRVVPFGRRLVGAAPRYALSVALRSLPRFAGATAARLVRGHATARVAIANLGDRPVLELDRHGRTRAEHAPKSVLWSGPYTLVAGATIPYFGFGLKMFPFAARAADRFQLRCGSSGLLEILRSTPAAFRGEFFSDSVRDFLCDRVGIAILDEDRAEGRAGGTSAIADGVPIEAGGELIGRDARLELRLASPITIATLARISDHQ